MALAWLGNADGKPFSLDLDTLTTHAVCVGMTGSGKTGLCVALLEEVAGAGVPVFAIDPKGDLTNLLRTEPESDGEKWKKGQSEWGIGPKEIAAWTEKVEVRVYTPGSEAARSIDVLGALRRPAEVDDDELRREAVLGTVSALLSLAGEEADPVRSPAHVVLSRILEEAWLRGEDPDLATLVGAVVDPPFPKVGVFPTDTFFKPDHRLDLARRLNTLLVSPSFAAWNKGTPLQIPAFLEASPGRTPLNIFSISHLSETERQFFCGLLLERLALWTRTLSGSSKLRALVFFDEVWGYLPPHPANPPTKRPLLTLFKQARAVGVGTVLATQNPVDLDYKALSNAGTWLVGRLQTKNDKARLEEGLSGAGMEAGEVDAWLGKVAPRRFLVHRVGKGPMLLDTRSTRVWLGGPLTRAQLRTLARPKEQAGTPKDAVGTSGPGPSATAPSAAAPSTPTTPSARSAGSPSRPSATFPPGPRWQRVLDPRVVNAARLEGAFTPYLESAGNAGIHLRPAFYLQVELRFEEARVGYSDLRNEHRVFFPLEDELPLAALVLPLDPADLLEKPLTEAVFDALPTWIDEAAEVEKLKSAVVADIVARESAGYLTNPLLKLHGRPGESAAAFEARCREVVAERVDEGMRSVSEKVQKKVDALEARIERLQKERDRRATEHGGKQTQEYVNVGQTLLSLFTGRTPSLNAIATKRRQVAEAEQRLEQADGDLAAAEREVYDLEASIEAQSEEIRRREEKALGATVEKVVGLDRGDVSVKAAGILWVPVGRRV